MLKTNKIHQRAWQVSLSDRIGLKNRILGREDWSLIPNSLREIIPAIQHFISLSNQ